MRHYHYRHTYRPFPFPWLLIGFAMLFLFGWKLFLIIPLLMLFGCWGFWGTTHMHYEDGYEKPKRKRHIEDDDDVTYV